MPISLLTCGRNDTKSGGKVSIPFNCMHFILSLTDNSRRKTECLRRAITWTIRKFISERWGRRGGGGTRKRLVDKRISTLNFFYESISSYSERNQLYVSVHNYWTYLLFSQVVSRFLLEVVLINRWSAESNIYSRVLSLLPLLHNDAPYIGLYLTPACIRRICLTRCCDHRAICDRQAAESKKMKKMKTLTGSTFPFVV